MIGIPLSEAVAVLKRDAVRTVLCRDGSGLTIDPLEWKDGRAALDMVDRLAPAALVVGMRA